MATVDLCINEIANTAIRELVQNERASWKKNNPNGSEQDFVNSFIEDIDNRNLNRIINVRKKSVSAKKQIDAYNLAREEMKKDGKDLSIEEYANAIVGMRQYNFTGSKQSLEVKLDAVSNVKGAEVQQAIRKEFDARGISLSKWQYGSKWGKQLDADLQRERANLNAGKTEPVTNNSLAFSLAKSFNKIAEETTDKMNRNGLQINKRFGYQGKQNHDRLVLFRAGFDKWYQETLPRIDMELSPFMQDREIARKVFNQLTHGGDNFASIPLAKQYQLDTFKINREINFKSVDDQIWYNETYGGGLNQAGIFQQQMQNFERKIVIENDFGGDVNAVVGSLLQADNVKRTGNAGDARKLQQVIDEVTGNALIDNFATAKFFDNVRSWVSSLIYGVVWLTTPMQDRVQRSFFSASRNGEAFNNITSLPKDLALGLKDSATYATKGVRYWKTGGISKAEQDIANSRGLMVSTFNSRFKKFSNDPVDGSFSTGFDKFTERVNGFFGTVGFLHSLQNNMENSFYVGLGEEIASKYFSQSFRSLNKAQKQLLNSYNIDETKFNILRKIDIPTNTIEGQSAKVFEPSMIRRLTDEEISPLVTGKNPKPADFKNAREELELEMRTIFTREMSETFFYKNSSVSVKSPKGSALGETLRFVAQVKTYPLLVYNNIIKKVYYNTALSMGEKAATSVSLTAAMLISGYGVEQINELRNNRTPRPLDNEMLTRTIARSGMLGIMSDFVLEPLVDTFDDEKSYYNTQNDLYKSLFNLLGVAPSKATDVTLGLVKLQKEGEADKIRRSLKGLIPANNTIGFGTLLNLAFDAMFQSEEEKRRKRKRLRETGQSQIIDTL